MVNSFRIIPIFIPMNLLRVIKIRNFVYSREWQAFLNSMSSLLLLTQLQHILLGIILPARNSCVFFRLGVSHSFIIRVLLLLLFRIHILFIIFFIVPSNLFFIFLLKIYFLFLYKIQIPVFTSLRVISLRFHEIIAVN